ncbi:homoserine kinase [Flavobacterium silvaticum]|uniref:Homoserine kinase n=1 Tax=Flavobacterium silvaticum TaxID=1852020 RepID=A0A972FRZ0_9FLAO|nr:homoserine kinase [Flavobacterium silvaticum]NMH26917.1 homoserine kinase [Flavobacterium silvaticum]
MNQIKLFSPATIANLCCGFDVMGLCLDNIGDEVEIHKSETPGVRIVSIAGADLPLEAEKNVAGVAALALLREWPTDFGFEISITKKIKAGSGIGSSAASAAAAVFGINELLGRPYEGLDLIRFAMQGEKLASGSAHADNVAPALLGAFTLIRSYDPLDVIRIDSPEDLYAVVIHPDIELRTADARSVLKQNVSLPNAIEQWGNLGGLVAGLYTKDYGLIGRSLQDKVIEPLRGILIPGFDKLKTVAQQAGALGSGISGSGPSVFALCKGAASAQQTADMMSAVYGQISLKHDVWISSINPKGIKILETN